MVILVRGQRKPTAGRYYLGAKKAPTATADAVERLAYYGLALSRLRVHRLRVSASDKSYHGS